MANVTVGTVIEGYKVLAIARMDKAVVLARSSANGEHIVGFLTSDESGFVTKWYFGDNAGGAEWEFARLERLG